MPKIIRKDGQPEKSKGDPLAIRRLMEIKAPGEKPAIERIKPDADEREKLLATLIDEHTGIEDILVKYMQRVRKATEEGSENESQKLRWEDAKNALMFMAGWGDYYYIEGRDIAGINEALKTYEVHNRYNLDERKAFLQVYLKAREEVLKAKGITPP